MVFIEKQHSPFWLEFIFYNNGLHIIPYKTLPSTVVRWGVGYHLYSTLRSTLCYTLGCNEEHIGSTEKAPLLDSLKQK